MLIFIVNPEKIHSVHAEVTLLDDELRVKAQFQQFVKISLFPLIQKTRADKGGKWMIFNHKLIISLCVVCFTL